MLLGVIKEDARSLDCSSFTAGVGLMHLVFWALEVWCSHQTIPCEPVYPVSTISVSQKCRGLFDWNRVVTCTSFHTKGFEGIVNTMSALTKASNLTPSCSYPV